MSIDIDRNFKRKPRQCWEHRTRKQQETAIVLMKKALKDGAQIKIAASEAGYDLFAAMRLFKHRTGKTMGQFRDEARQRPQ